MLWMKWVMLTSQNLTDVILIFKFATHNFGVRFTVISVIIFFHYTSAHAKDRDLLLNFLMLPYIHWRWFFFEFQRQHCFSRWNTDISLLPRPVCSPRSFKVLTSVIIFNKDFLLQNVVFFLCWCTVSET